MAATQATTVVGVFEDRAAAQRAVNELKRLGFDDNQIGVISRERSEGGDAGDDDEGSYAGEGAAAGLATGAGVGALWGLGIIAGVLPAIGPAIAGGTLAAILSSAAAGAAAAGIAGALVGLGIPKDEAEYYEGEFKSGRTLVTVKGGTRNDEALRVMRQFGATDITNRGQSATGLAGSTHTGAARTGHSESALKGPSMSTPAGQSCTTPASTSHAGTAQAGAMHAGKDTLQAKEEQLHVSKEKVQTGGVDIRKEVHTEHKTIEVPVEREEVVIERRPGSGQPARMGDMGQQEIHVPNSEEHVHVEKTPVVKEEVSVGKRKVRENEQVSENLRKEEIKVEKDGDINVRDTTRRNV
jgi:uncharacterized protein (TIGR02271 family)